jgi:hypothetical protein
MNDNVRAITNLKPILTIIGVERSEIIQVGGDMVRGIRIKKPPFLWCGDSGVECLRWRGIYRSRAS